MAEDAKKETKSALAVLDEWKAIIGFVLLLFGGYFWLEKNYAKIDKLASEKCVLSYEIRITRADIEFENVDEEIDKQRNALDGLLQSASTSSNLISFKKGYIQSLEQRAEKLDDLKECLFRARKACLQDDRDTEKCYD